MSAVDELEKLLDEERDAARRADVDRLVSLQEEKRAVLDRLGAISLSTEDRARIGRRAEANLALMRHLSQCLGAYLGAGNPTTYSATGLARPSVPPARIRGSL